MPVSLIVAYPHGTNIDIEYYVTKHIPMIMTRWKPYVKSYRVLTSMGSSLSSSSFPQTTTTSSSCPSIAVNGVLQPQITGRQGNFPANSVMDDNPYALMTVTEFDSLEDIAEARVSVDEAGEREIVEDLKRCTDRKPVWWTVETLGE